MLDELVAVTKAVAEDVLLYNGDSFLIPLFLMLAVVMVIIMVPALLAVQ